MGDTETLIGYTYLRSINEHEGIHQRGQGSDGGLVEQLWRSGGCSAERAAHVSNKGFQLKKMLTGTEMMLVQGLKKTDTHKSFFTLLGF